MPIPPSRRQFLQALGSTLLAPALASATSIADAPDARRRARRRKVGIVGGGIGGVAAAWLLDGDCDVVLFEAESHLGGHAHTITVDYGGRQVAVDVGAQNFAPSTHPTYSKLLELLGLFDPTDLSRSPTVTVPLSLTAFTSGAATPLFVSPYLPDRTWPIGESWNTPALAAFTGLIAASQELEKNDLDWTVTLEDWVESIAIPRDQKDGLVYPFVASLNNSEVAAAKALSARAAIYFVSRALPENPFAGVTYYNSLFGLGGIVQKLADDCTTLTVHTGAPVRDVARRGARYRIATNDHHELVDHLIVATPPYVAAKLLRRLPQGQRVAKVLASFPYFRARITIHTDPAFVPAERRFWSFDNVEIANGFGQGSLWYGAVQPPLADGSTIDIFKSWTTNRDHEPQAPLYSEDFLHALPSPDFGRAQVALDRFQGRQRVWFVGSHCLEVDSQDTALRSAMRVADVLAPTSPHYEALKASISPAPVEL